VPTVLRLGGTRPVFWGSYVFQPIAKTTKMTPNRQCVKLTTTVSLPF